MFELRQTKSSHTRRRHGTLPFSKPHQGYETVAEQDASRLTALHHKLRQTKSSHTRHVMAHCPFQSHIRDMKLYDIFCHSSSSRPSSSRSSSFRILHILRKISLHKDQILVVSNASQMTTPKFFYSGCKKTSFTCEPCRFRFSHGSAGQPQRPR